MRHVARIIDLARATAVIVCTPDKAADAESMVKKLIDDKGPLRASMVVDLANRTFRVVSGFNRSIAIEVGITTNILATSTEIVSSESGEPLSDIECACFLLKGKGAVMRATVVVVTVAIIAAVGLSYLAWQALND